MKQPYRFWTRDQLYAHLLTQALNFSYDEKFIDRLHDIVYDERWDPSKDFNGCNVVQDHYHPFLPCFIHDYRWVVEEGGLASDREFYWNLIKCGVNKTIAILYFEGVRLGWVLFFKWKKKFNF
jgi:hypothetical protein